MVGAARSGAYLLFTFLGGATFFFGPIIGAVLMVLAFVLFSEFTKAWLLYLGPDLPVHGDVCARRHCQPDHDEPARCGLSASCVAVGCCTTWRWPVTLAIALAGAGALIEMVYHLQLNATAGSELRFAGVGLDVASAWSWLGAGMVMLVGAGLFEVCRRRFAESLEPHAQEEIQQEIQRRDAQ